MKRTEFREKILPLSATEKSWLNEYRRTGKLHCNTFSGPESDKEGLPLLTNKYMLLLDDADYLHMPLVNPYLGNNLRLIIHQRFQQIPLHSTEFISIDYVYRGSLIISFKDGHSLNLHTGQLCLINADLLHAYRIFSENDIIFNFQIQRDFLSKHLLSDLKGSGPVIDFLLKMITGQSSDFTFLIAGFENDERMRNLFEDLYCEFLDPGIISDVLAANYIRTFFTMLVRSTESLVHTNTRTDILSIINDIAAHPEDISLEKLASRYHFNSKYLGNLIKRQTGKNFQDLLEESRMGRAVYLLTVSELSIREIAGQCGYSNLTFFYSHFQRRYGRTPAQYREAKSRNSLPKVREIDV